MKEDPSAPRYVGIESEYEAGTRSALIIIWYIVLWPITIVITIIRGGETRVIIDKAKRECGIEIVSIRSSKRLGKSFEYICECRNGKECRVTFNKADNYFNVSQI